MKLRCCCWWLVVTLLLGACASLPTLPITADLFHDSWFQPPTVPIDAGEVFALTDRMRDYVHTDIAPQLRRDGNQLGLFNALRDSGQLKLEYDAAITRNAAEAFSARTGNCLSLAILTAALADEIGLDVQFQNVLGERTISRNGDLLFYNDHVNLELRDTRNDDRSVATGKVAMVIDFLPARDRRGRAVRSVSKPTLLAMYMNNRAAESLAAGKIDDAYWWARAAIQQEPRYTATYNTLGVIYRRHGQTQAALSLLNYALTLEPGNIAAMSNIIPLLEGVGKTRESAQWQQRLRQLQSLPPFYFFEQGRLAMQEQQFERARELFAKEIERTKYYHEFHFWLGLAYVGLHQPELARKHFAIAEANATTRADAKRYQEALDALGPSPRKRGGLKPNGLGLWP